MSLKKTLKNVALAGMTFAAGFGAYHATHSDPEKKDAIATKTVADTGTTAVQYRKITQDSYELRAGVLMPFSGETAADYEARRVRLENQENQLRARMVRHYQERLAELEAKHANPDLIDAVLDRLEEHQQAARYISCYTTEGQKRLAVYRQNQQAPLLGRGRAYDF